MNNKTKEFLKIYEKYQPMYDEIEKEIERILMKLFHYSSYNIGNPTWVLDENNVSVSFDCTCMGYTDKEYETFPTKLLFEDDEFINKYLAEQAEKSRKLAEKRERERQKQKEKEERDQLKSLLNKYGSDTNIFPDKGKSSTNG